MNSIGSAKGCATENDCSFSEVNQEVRGVQVTCKNIHCCRADMCNGALRLRTSIGIGTIFVGPLLVPIIAGTVKQSRD